MIKGWEKILPNYKLITNKDIPILNNFLTKWNPHVAKTYAEPLPLKRRKLTQTLITNTMQCTTSANTISTNSPRQCIQDTTCVPHDNRTPETTQSLNTIQLNKMTYKKTGVRRFYNKTKDNKKQITEAVIHDNKTTTCKTKRTSNIGNYLAACFNKNNGTSINTNYYNSTNNTNEEYIQTSQNPKNRLLEDIIPNVCLNNGDKPILTYELKDTIVNNNMHYETTNESELTPITYHPQTNKQKWKWLFNLESKRSKNDVAFT